jgi:hypothetical protein
MDVERMTAKFALALTEPRLNVRYVGLSFRSYLAERNYGTDPFIAEVCGESMDYGKLFAYCFRRFGYPNTGWDDYKELTAYLLSTPHPDMILEVIPYVGDTSHLQLRFMVAEESHRAIEAYAQRDRQAWKARSIAWLESNGLPEWMEEWRQFCNATPDLVELGGECLRWTDTIRWMTFGPMGKPGSVEFTQTQRAHAFYKQWHADFEAIEPYPQYGYREGDWTNWADEDPLKAFAQAAHEALLDLRRPVGVRDLSIDAFGATESEEEGAECAAVAGYPSGALGNVAPEEFAELHRLIVQLGEGDVKLGIGKARDLLSQALKTPH